MVKQNIHRSLLRLQRKNIFKEFNRGIIKNREREKTAMIWEEKDQKQSRREIRRQPPRTILSMRKTYSEAMCCMPYKLFRCYHTCSFSSHKCASHTHAHTTYIDSLINQHVCKLTCIHTRCNIIHEWLQKHFRKFDIWSWVACGAVNLTCQS